MDFYVGKIIAKLKEKNLLDNILVVLAGDHGEGLGEKGEEGHGVFLYEESMRVPLIFFAGDRLPAKRIIKARVRLIDIMPTILDMLRIPLPEKIQGQSLLPYIEKRSSKDLPNYMETYFPAKIMVGQNSLASWMAPGNISRLPRKSFIIWLTTRKKSII